MQPAVLVASISALIALSSLAVSIVAIRAAGPRVTVHATVDLSERPHSAIVTILNRGRSDIAVELGMIRIWVAQTLPELDQALKLRPGRKDVRVPWEGPELPFRVPAYDRAQWKGSLDRVEWRNSGELKAGDRVELLLRIGHRDARVRVRLEAWNLTTRVWRVGLSETSATTAGSGSLQVVRPSRELRTRGWRRRKRG